MLGYDAERKKKQGCVTWIDVIDAHNNPVEA
jgi:hypothetical protein